MPSPIGVEFSDRFGLGEPEQIEGCPVNELFREAVKNYPTRRDLSSLEGTTSALRGYQKQDSGFKKAIGELVETEAAFIDPLEADGQKINSAQCNGKSETF